MFHIIMGDFNVKVGRLITQREPCIGQHGLGTRNERGQLLVDFATSINMVIQNTCFKKKENSKWTWRSPNGKLYNQIDYFLCSKNLQTQDMSTINKIHTGSDQRMLRAKIKLNTRLYRKKLTKTGNGRNIDHNLLSTIGKDNYNLILGNKFEKLEREYLEEVIPIEELNKKITNIITNTSEQLAKRGTKNNRQTKISQNTMKLI